MTALRARFAAFRPRFWSQRMGQAFRRPGARAATSLVVLLVGVVTLAPVWWWHRLTALLTGPGWRWLPILVVVAGGIALGREAVWRWRRGRHSRSRPVAERVPLFGHVTVLLLLAATAAVAVGCGLWLAFGRPNLHASGQPTAWSVANTFDAIKIMLAVVAGIGGVVALTVAYRKQEHGEAAEHRENTKLFNDRFGRAADQLGSGQAAVRLAGVYAMAGLADNWAEGRQTCIDVLCAYLRMPYTPPPEETPPPSDPSVAGLPLSTVAPGDGHEARQERQVRHTVLALIREHLQPADDEDRPRWHRQRFDLRGAVVDGGDLSGIDVPAGTVIDLTAATFPTGTVTFENARFSGGTVTFHHARFSGGTVHFRFATFSDGTVSFYNARFISGEVAFSGARFSGGMVDFSAAEFSGSAVGFRRATFSGGTHAFDNARFSAGTIDFSDVAFSGGELDFSIATFFNGKANFDYAVFSGSMVNFRFATFSGGTVTFSKAAFSNGSVDFGDATLSGGTVDFDGAVFSGGRVTFRDAIFSKDCAVNLRSPARWAMPPKGVDRSMPGVLWPSRKDLVKLTAAG